MKRIWLSALLLVNMTFAHAGDNFVCEYMTSENGTKTKLSFSLPSPAKFGVLVPVTIKPGKGTTASMNTVIIKDYPYLVLADVYRIETNNSRIALLKISPDRSEIEMAYVNMGGQQAAKFYEGSCYQTGAKN